MPYKNNQRGGTLIIDRVFPGVGRIQKATGVERLEDYKLISAMLTQLSRSGKLEILREIKAGTVSILEVFGYHNSGQLEHTPSTFTLKTIDPTIIDWIDRYDIAESTRYVYREAIKVFVKVVGKNTQISDLPIKLKTYREYCQKRETLRTFNLARSICQSFLKNNLGRHHPLWQQVSQLKKFTIKVEDMKQAPSLSVPEVKHLLDVLDEVHAKTLEAMVFTGMGISEVMGQWSEEVDRIVIKGTKRESRVREVPLVQPDLSHPKLKETAFRKALKKIRPDLSSRSFRRTYAFWLEAAGIVESRRNQYMGHTVKTMTERYTRHEVDNFLREDAKTVRAYIRKEWEESKEEKEETTVEPLRTFKPWTKIPW